MAGTLKRLEREREDEATRAMRELQRVSGIGVQRAKELIEGGVTSLEALRQAEAAKAKLSRGELIGLYGADTLRSGAVHMRRLARGPLSCSYSAAIGSCVGTLR